MKFPVETGWKVILKFVLWKKPKATLVFPLPDALIDAPYLKMCFESRMDPSCLPWCIGGLCCGSGIQFSGEVLCMSGHIVLIHLIEFLYMYVGLHLCAGTGWKLISEIFWNPLAYCTIFWYSKSTWFVMRLSLSYIWGHTLGPSGPNVRQNHSILLSIYSWSQ